MIPVADTSRSPPRQTISDDHARPDNVPKGGRSASQKDEREQARAAQAAIDRAIAVSRKSQKPQKRIRTEDLVVGEAIKIRLDAKDRQPSFRRRDDEIAYYKLGGGKIEGYPTVNEAIGALIGKQHKGLAKHFVHPASKFLFYTVYMADISDALRAFSGVAKDKFIKNLLAVIGEIASSGTRDDDLIKLGEQLGDAFAQEVKPIALPDKAPELYRSKELDGPADQFLKRVWGPYLEAKKLHQNILRTEYDPKLMAALDRQFGPRRNELRALIPMKADEVNDRLERAAGGPIRPEARAAAVRALSVLERSKIK